MLSQIHNIIINRKRKHIHTNYKLHKINKSDENDRTVCFMLKRKLKAVGPMSTLEKCRR